MANLQSISFDSISIDALEYSRCRKIAKVNNRANKDGKRKIEEVEKASKKRSK